MAEVAARAAAERSGFDPHIAFASAGVEPSAIGAPADPRAVACVAAAGLDLSGHRTQAAATGLLAASHRIVALDHSVHQQLLDMVADPVTARVVALMDFAPSLGVTEVADPWHGNALDYAAAFRLIGAATDGLVARLRTE